MNPSSFAYDPIVGPNIPQTEYIPESPHSIQPEPSNPNCAITTNQPGLALDITSPPLHPFPSSPPSSFFGLSLDGLPIQQISAPVNASSNLAINSYVSSQDDPFSPLRSNAYPQMKPNGNVIIPNGLCTTSHDTHWPPVSFLSDIQRSYPVDQTQLALSAPHMEQQLSCSTLFGSNVGLPVGDDLMDQGDMGRSYSGCTGFDDELQSAFAGIEMSASVPNESMAAIMPLPSLECAGEPIGDDGIPPTTAGLEESLIPDLTDTVATPSSPAQMSRQCSFATDYTGSVGMLRSASASSPQILGGSSHYPDSIISPSYPPPYHVSINGQNPRKRPREDPNVLLSGLDIEPQPPAAFDYGDPNASTPSSLINNTCGTVLWGHQLWLRPGSGLNAMPPDPRAIAA